MSNRKASLEIDIIPTDDGSPTISLNGGEKMHSMAGALSETLYIYGPCIEQVMSCSDPAVLSMGLGLAYNELLAIAYGLKYGATNLNILSFEKEVYFIDQLKKFLKSEPSELTSCYELICKKIEDNMELSAHTLKEQALAHLESGRLNLKGPLTAINPNSQTYHGVLYDAFSNQSDEDLWDEEHLDSFIKSYCSKEFCFFSTYAATGNLKRALKKNNFIIEKKKGFGHKRESTFAHRKRLPLKN